MTEIVVISDTHGYKKHLEYLDEVYGKCDMIIHLGDTSADGQKIQERYPDKTHILNGNCDIMPTGQDEEIIEVEGLRILACHGHKYSVKSSRVRLAERAAEARCDVALYGHTHQAREEKICGVTLLNPGSGARFSSQTYLILTVRDKDFKSEIVTFG